MPKEIKPSNKSEPVRIKQAVKNIL
jgi:hypothetical protein